MLVRRPVTTLADQFFLEVSGFFWGVLAILRTMRSRVSSLVSTPASRAASSNRFDCSSGVSGFRFFPMNPHLNAALTLESVPKKWFSHNSRRVASPAMGPWLAPWGSPQL